MNIDMMMLLFSGSFKNKAFIGELQLADKAIELDFNGNIDLNVQPLEFDFSLNLKTPIFIN